MQKGPSPAKYFKLPRLDNHIPPTKHFKLTARLAEAVKDASPMRAQGASCHKKGAVRRYGGCHAQPVFSAGNKLPANLSARRRPRRVASVKGKPRGAFMTELRAAASLPGKPAVNQGGVA